MNLSRATSFAARLSGGLAVLLLMAGFLGQVQAQPVTTAVPFLLIEPDSRAAAMGNTGVALANDANAVFWNPAGLAFQKNAGVGFTHANWLPEFNADLSLEYLMGKHHFPEIGTFGAHVTYFNLGEYEVRNSNNEVEGEFKAYELSIGASYGLEINERFALGFGLRGIYSDLANQTGTGQEVTAAKSFGLDIGGLYRMDPFELEDIPVHFSAGFNIANMGPHVKYIEVEDPIPTTFRAGYALTFDFDEYNQLTFTNDFSKLLVNKRFEQEGDSITVETDPFYKALFTSWSAMDTDPNEEGSELGLLQQITTGVGLEYWYDQLFALRTGYYYEHPDNGNRRFLSFGAGLRYNIFGVDLSYLYALEEESPLSNTLRVSVLLDFNR